MKKTLFRLFFVLAIGLSACTPATSAPAAPVEEVAAEEAPEMEEAAAEEAPVVEEVYSVELSELVFEPFDYSCQLPPVAPMHFGSERVHFVKGINEDTAYWKVSFEGDTAQNVDIFPVDVLEETHEFFAGGVKVAEVNAHMEVIIWECPANGYYSRIVTFTEGESDVVVPPGYYTDVLNVSWEANAPMFEVEFTDYTGRNIRWTFTDYSYEGFWSIHRFEDNRLVEDLSLNKDEHYIFDTMHPDLLRTYKLIDFYWGETTVKIYERLEVTVSAE